MSGIIIFPIVLIYIFVAFLIYKLVLKNTNKKFLSSMVFIGILTFPFWDIILANIIVLAYKPFATYTIYEYPQIDKNGRIESIGGGLLNYNFASRFFDKKEFDKYLNKDFPDMRKKVSDFIEFPIKTDYRDELNKIRIKEEVAKVYLQKDTNFVEIKDEYEARYIKKIEEEYKNYGLLGIRIGKTVIFDTILNKELASSPIFFIEGNEIMLNIRNNIFVSGGSQTPMFGGVGIISEPKEEMIKKLFNIEGLKWVI